MSAPVDTTPAAQGKRKRPQKEKTPASQGSKRVKSHHAEHGNDENVHVATPISTKQSKTPDIHSTHTTNAPQKDGDSTPSTKPAKDEKNAVAVQHGKNSRRQRRPARSAKQHKEQRPSVTASSAIISAFNQEKKDLWTMSRSSGGRFIAHDPIVSVDDKYVVKLRSGTIRTMAANGFQLCIRF